jgi:oligopeptide/dipeptide ABC transporter ATP-binding protein
VSESEPLLRVEGLDVSVASPRGRLPVLSGVAFSMPRSGALALVGESGCGKSLTVFALMGLLPSGARIDHGSIELEGRELTKLRDGELDDIRGNRIGLVFQEPASALDPVYTIGSQISEAIRLHRDVSRREARTLAVEWLRRVGMPTPEARFDAYPHELSGGMRQRAMLAIAMANEPALLVADEPTTSLDRTLEAQILELFDELRRERGTALLLVSHDLAVVSEVTDDVVVLYAGEVVERGPTRDVLLEPAHPYTRALLASVPDPSAFAPARRGGEPRRLPTIPGQVPPLDELPPGCRFAPRCSEAFERCRTEHPPEYELGSERGARCFLHAKAGAP